MKSLDEWQMEQVLSELDRTTMAKLGVTGGGQKIDPAIRNILARSLLMIFNMAQRKNLDMAEVAREILMTAELFQSQIEKGQKPQLLGGFISASQIS